ncbi:Predicted arabinose efflux permease, MFS family [Amycolatopsis arida]|uniref:Predicted arabinose efflux permease, MFS family n=1 Tax=Amycolatopsis arida TaxID=587909 RepID=A0A1I5XVA3_9PSEU|nr:MFS transporter [Amycolatopsis arida]TDX97245.1 putative MFS family arabinose efflux permease [Amycolatopsis arida]SFQ35878.1 Predicted arabinose efflux permease, MFS family [Amycolatopsis arida]
MSPLRDRDFRLLLSVTVTVIAGFALLLPVVPMWVTHQGAGELAAGGSTGVFMASTVLAQFAVPTLVRARGYRMALLLGALLLGPPTALLVLATDAPGILAISFVRGLGFGLVTVCGSALVAELLPREVLARGAGLHGLATGVPQLVGMPAGPWLATHLGFPAVFLLAAALPAVGVVLTALLRDVTPAAADDRYRLALLTATWRPWLVMLAGSTGYGALATFLPIVLGGSGTVALLVVAGTALLARWTAGRIAGGVAGAGRMLPFALAGVGLGLLGFAATTGTPALAVAAVALFGVGFGVVQNDALVLMFSRAAAGPASVAWNVAFDAGQGLGAVAVGAMVGATGFPVAFGLLGVAALVLLPVAITGRGRG